MKGIYMDSAATEMVEPDVKKAIMPFYDEEFANPSSSYTLSDLSRNSIELSRCRIARFINCKPEEIYFTSGGSESDNWAIKGVADALRNKGNHIITTKIEHHAVLNSCKFLEERGYEVTYLDVNSDGQINLIDLYSSIRPDTILISIMMANNEIGAIQPIAQVGNIAKKMGIILHVDAVQAYGHIPIDLQELDIDLLSASGHKIGAPKGVGLLYIKEGTPITPLIHGGSQESNMRAGTYNVPAIVGFGCATQNIDMRKQKSIERIRDHMIQSIRNRIDCCELNGGIKHRLPNNVNFRFDGIEGETALIMLDKHLIFASSGSACNSKSLEPSHVLKAIGLTDEEAHSSIRFTLSERTTMDDVDFVVNILENVIQRARI